MTPPPHAGKAAAAEADVHAGGTAILGSDRFLEAYDEKGRRDAEVHPMCRRRWEVRFRLEEPLFMFVS